MPKQTLLFDEDEITPERYPAAFLPPDPDAPHLKKIEIKSFKGLKDITIEFPKIAILTGPNNSGKSAILQAIVTGFECFRLCLDTDFNSVTHTVPANGLIIYDAGCCFWKTLEFVGQPSSPAKGGQAGKRVNDT